MKISLSSYRHCGRLHSVINDRYMLNVDSCSNSENMCHFIHAVVPGHVETVVKLDRI